MATPTGHTYRYGEHNPLAERGGAAVVYRETPTPYPRMAESARAALEGQAQRSLARLERSSGDIWGRVLNTIRRFPIASCVAVLGASFLISRSLVRGTRSGFTHPTFR